MEQVVLWIVLGSGSALLIVSILSLVARPRPVLMVLPLVGCALFAWQVLWGWLEYRDCNRILAANRRYDLDTSVFGHRAVRIDALPGVEGFQLLMARNDSHEFRPVLLAELKWRGEKAASFRQPNNSFLVIQHGGGKWLDVTYRVDDATRPLFEGVHLEVTPTFDTLKSCSIGGDLSRFWAWICAGAALICLAGFVTQIVKRTRAARLARVRASGRE